MKALHQLRTPIYTIRGWLEILSDENRIALHPKALEGISNALQHLEGVWNGVQDYYDILQSKS